MKITLIALIYLAFSCQTQQGTGQKTGNEELANLFEQIESYGKSSQDSLYMGLHPKGEWESSSYAARLADADSLQLFLERLEAISDESLDEQEKISKTVMLIRLNNSIDNVKFKMLFIPFNAEGGFYNSMSYTLSNLPFKSAQDYYDYLNWLPKYQQSLTDNLVLMKMGIEEGMVAPKVIVNNNLNLLKPWVVENMEDSPFYTPLKELPESIDETDAELIKKKAIEVIGSLQDSYTEVHNFLADEYMPVAKEQPGISFVPTGKEYYENRVKHYSTLPLTADSVHQLGLSEVKRIRASMDKIIADLNFEGSFADFIQFLRTDDQFYAKTPQELLNRAAWLSKKAEGQLPKLFNKLYSLPFTVEPVPASIAPTYTGGRYVEGSWESKRAGIYWVNTYNLKSRTLYTLPALTLHEAVPGHHLQGAVTGELKGVPEFRNNYYISAFGEGWGLYSEYLGEEMGMYSTPYELFGRYTYEMWRACRLVVDTGIHTKGWSREDALKFLSENTALSIHEVTTEIDRYIGWPGQALSYKIGEIKIKSLRKMAESELGDKFNIGEFHQAILENGSVPLTVLEEQINKYIDAKLSENP
ncbi:DUF885 domain-containing protein [Fulvivirga sp.]|uniref:DUF885 domain-containing protein n=1 Tax=Fulvivirga sp. TaxID=1931237 RepID=UPI0032EE4A36